MYCTLQNHIRLTAIYAQDNQGFHSFLEYQISRSLMVWILDGHWFTYYVFNKKLFTKLYSNTRCLSKLPRDPVPLRNGSDLWRRKTESQTLTCTMIYKYSRVEWFLKIKLATCHFVVDCSGTPNPKFYIDLLLFHLAHGLRKPLKSQKALKSAHKHKNS